jgi:hypothetical protein
MLQSTSVPPHPTARRHARLVFVLAFAIGATGARCNTPPSNPPSTQQTAEISRERAIEIARKQVSFGPDSVDAVQVTSEGPGRPVVWRVTFKGRLPDQPPGLFETRVFEIDVRTGEIVAGSMN